jgi:hypothetical protein
VAPPQQHVGLGENFRGEAMLGLIERGRGHLPRFTQQRLHGLLDRRMQPLWVDFRDRGARTFVDEFVPNEGAQGTGHGNSYEELRDNQR